MRRKFYMVLGATFPVFFLLHWNGLFSPTYYWALEEVGGTDRVLPQVTFAFISALAIFGIIAGLFELAIRIGRRPAA